MRTPAKVDFLPGMLQGDCPLWWLFRQASRAYDQILRFCEAYLGVSGEDIGAALATEKVFFAVMAMLGRLFFADS